MNAITERRTYNIIALYKEKKMKRICILCIALMMMFSITATSYGDTGSGVEYDFDRDSLIEKTLLEYMGLKEFQNYLEADSEEAYAMIENIVDSAIEEAIMPAWMRVEPDV